MPCVTFFRHKIRAVVSFMSLFLVALFGAVITSSLTAATLESNAPTLQQVTTRTNKRPKTSLNK